MKISLRRSHLPLLVAGLLLLSLTSASSAASIGYYLNAASGNPAAAITAAGHTPVALGGLTPGDLAGISVLWLLNGSNGGYGSLDDNAANIAAFVNTGGVLSFHDRTVSITGGPNASAVLPGVGGVNFVRSLGTDIDIVTANAVTAGLNNTSLDGGNFSFHGYVLDSELPTGGVAVLSTGSPRQIVDFYYPYGAGWVYYSTIPLDFYLGGAGNNPPADTIRNIYAPQEAGFQASLAAPIPEPATYLSLGLGFLSLALLRRRK